MKHIVHQKIIYLFLGLLIVVAGPSVAQDANSPTASPAPTAATESAAPSAAPTSPPAPPAAQAPVRVITGMDEYFRGRTNESNGNKELAQKNFFNALNQANARLEISPSDMNAHAVKTMSLFRLGNYDQAIAAGRTGLSVSNDPRIIETMGEAYFFLDNNAASMAMLQQYLNMVDDTADRYATAYFYIGELYSRMRQYEHAEVAYATATYSEPSLARWWYKLGLMRENLSRWQGALNAYQKAINLSPSYQEALDGRGRVQSKVTN